MIEESSNQSTTQKELKTNKPKKIPVKPKKISWAWPLKIFIITLTLSLIFSISSEILLSGTGIIVSLIIIIVLLLISVAFDMLGVAMASANLEPFVAMSSKRVKGAKQAIQLLKHAEKVSSFSSDVIGDMCGILSGAVGASIAMQIYSVTNDIKTIFIAALVSSIIAALTVFGKALGKKFAINEPDKIVLLASKILALFGFATGKEKK